MACLCINNNADHDQAIMFTTRHPNATFHLYNTGLTGLMFCFNGKKSFGLSSNQIKSIYLSSRMWGVVVALSSEPEAHVLNARAFRIELEVRCVGFEGRGKPKYLEKNLWEQRWESTTNSPQIWHGLRESKPVHIGGRWVLSSLSQPCSPSPL